MNCTRLLRTSIIVVLVILTTFSNIPSASAAGIVAWPSAECLQARLRMSTLFFVIDAQQENLVWLTGQMEETSEQITALESQVPVDQAQIDLYTEKLKTWEYLVESRQQALERSQQEYEQASADVQKYCLKLF